MRKRLEDHNSRVNHGIIKSPIHGIFKLPLFPRPVLQNSDYLSYLAWKIKIVVKHPINFIILYLDSSVIV